MQEGTLGGLIGGLPQVPRREPTKSGQTFWSNYNNSEIHLIFQGLNSATSRNKAGSTSQWDPQHMAGQSAVKAHYKTHDAPAAPRGPAGVVGFACAFASLWPAMCRESHRL